MLDKYLIQRHHWWVFFFGALKWSFYNIVAPFGDKKTSIGRTDPKMQVWNEEEQQNPHLITHTWKAVEGTVVIFSRVKVSPNVPLLPWILVEKNGRFTLCWESVHVFSVHINPDWKQNTYIYYIMNPSNSHITPTWMALGSSTNTPPLHTHAVAATAAQ